MEESKNERGKNGRELKPKRTQTVQFRKVGQNGHAGGDIGCVGIFYTYTNVHSVLRI